MNHRAVLQRGKLGRRARFRTVALVLMCSNVVHVFSQFYEDRRRIGTSNDDRRRMYYGYGFRHPYRRVYHESKFASIGANLGILSYNGNLGKRESIGSTVAFLGF